MNITFLIGNGFDIALGLKTDYENFLHKYITVDSNNDIITDFKAQIRKGITEYNDESQHDKLQKIDNWADLELAFGNYTENLNTEEEILIIYNDIMENIKTYIAEQEKLIDFNVNREKISPKFLKDVLNFYGELKPLHKNNFITVNQINTKPESVYYNFITFNYTSCIEECVNTILKENRLISPRKIGNTNWGTYIGKVINIHGSLKDNRIIFGLDNESQLHYKGEKSNSLLRKIIKPAKNINLGYGTDAEATSVINNSSIICVFGTSIGDTDFTWWKKLGTWIKSAPNRQLLLFNYNPEFKKIKSSAIMEDIRLDNEEEFKVVFKEQAGLNITDDKNVDNRIYALINSDIFQLKLIEIG